MNLPAELKRYQRNQILKRLAVCLGLETVAVVLLILFGDRIGFEGFAGAEPIVKVVILLIPFIITRVPFSLFGRSYYGTIVKVDVETTLKKEFAGRGSILTINTMYLRIEKDDGGGAIEKIYEEVANDRCDFDYYRAGDRVFKLARSKYVIVLPHGTDTRPLCCAVCGSSNKHEDTVCHRCGLPLVKDEEG